MTRWTELLLLLALIAAGASGQSVPAGAMDPSAGVAGQRAVLLEPAALYGEASSGGEVVVRLDAGTVLEYAGAVTDDFGRTWYAVRDPRRLERRVDVFLAPFDLRRLREFGYRAAVLADRQPLHQRSALTSTASTPASGGATGEAGEPPWWTPVGVVDLDHWLLFEDVLGVSATAAAEAELREAIDLLGGREAIADWPAQPLPGELFVPDMLPALFQFDGATWDLAAPARLFADSVSVLGNGAFAVDGDAPPLAGGPAVYCWDLINALDPGGAAAGSLAVAPAPAPPARGDPVPRDMGPFDIAAAPEPLRPYLPPAPDAMLVPPRIDPPQPATGVRLADEDGRQAVYLEQRIGEALTRRLRGRAMVFEAVARDDPRAGAATFGMDVEVTFADRPPETIETTSHTSAPSARRYQLPFVVPDDAEDVTLRLLPLDRSLAVEQQGSVLFDRAALRAAEWDPDPPPGAVVLNRIVATSFEGARLYTREAVAVSDREVNELQAAWERVAGTDWSLDDQRLVLAGELRPGMSAEQVIATWGEPARRVPLADESGVEWYWEADDRYAVFSGGALALSRPPTTRDQTPVARMCPAQIR